MLRLASALEIFIVTIITSHEDKTLILQRIARLYDPAHYIAYNPKTTYIHSVYRTKSYTVLMYTYQHNDERETTVEIDSMTQVLHNGAYVIITTCYSITIPCELKAYRDLFLKYGI